MLTDQPANFPRHSCEHDAILRALRDFAVTREITPVTRKPERQWQLQFLRICDSGQVHQTGGFSRGHFNPGKTKLPITLKDGKHYPRLLIDAQRNALIEVIRR